MGNSTQFRRGLYIPNRKDSRIPFLKVGGLPSPRTKEFFSTLGFAGCWIVSHQQSSLAWKFFQSGGEPGGKLSQLKPLGWLNGCKPGTPRRITHENPSWEGSWEILENYIKNYDLELQGQPVYKWMDGNGDFQPTISYVKICVHHHPIDSRYHL